MTVIQIKESLHKLINKIEDEALLKTFLEIIESKIAREKDINKESPVTIEQYNKELEEAEAEIDQGDFYTHQQAVEKIREWRKN